MSSKFKPNAQKPSYPSWCKAKPPPEPIGIPYPGPSPLQAFAYWRTYECPIPFWMSESFALQPDFYSPSWTGQSAPSRPYLKLIVEKVGATDTYDVELIMFWPDTFDESYQWSAIPLYANEPFKLHPPDVHDEINRPTQQVFVYG